jgi:hypothetical protein
MLMENGMDLGEIEFDDNHQLNYGDEDGEQEDIDYGFE